MAKIFSRALTALLLLLFSFPFNSGISRASVSIVVRPDDFDAVMALIDQRVDLRRAAKFAPKGGVSGNKSTFGPWVALAVKKTPRKGQVHPKVDDKFIVYTVFMVKSPTIIKRVQISQGHGRDDKAMLRLVLDDERQPFDNFFHTRLGVPMEIYNRPGDMFVYLQAPTGPNAIEMKEWIFARRPNCPEGTRYRWKVISEEFYRRLVLEPGKDGVKIQRQIVIQGIDPNDYAKQRHAIASIKKVMQNKVYISGEDTIGTIEPVAYITREGRRAWAQYRILNRDVMEMIIHEPPQSYPILIESD